MENFETQFIKVGDIQLHVVFAGPEDGEPIMLLHGFPEFWYGWHNQIPVLAEAGYRVIVPDQRGYNRSAKPSGVKAYSIGKLATDVQQLAAALGYEQINLVGHDWGAAVAWSVASIYPHLLKKLIILNVPHPGVMMRAFSNLDFAQITKSWYIGFFQLPAVPEAILSRNDYQGFAQLLQRSGKPDTFSDVDIAKYREAWRQPGAITSMINWYRAMTRGDGGGSLNPDKTRITMPTLILWGEQDVALEKGLAQQSVDLCDDGELIYFPNATHWIQHDEAAAVNEAIIEFVQREDTTADLAEAGE